MKKIISIAALIAGLIFLVGSVGAYEQDIIDITQFLLQVGAGLMVSLFGCYGIWLDEARAARSIKGVQYYGSRKDI